MFTFNKIKWHLSVIAALGTLVFLLLWLTVFISYYVTLVNPGLERSVYDQFALDTGGPFVFCTGPFVVYLVSRWLCSQAGTAFYSHAVLYILFYELLDLLTLVGIGDLTFFYSPIHLVNASAMLGASLLGAYLAIRKEKKQADQN